MLYTKVNSCVTREFGPSNLTKIQEHTRVAARECQLRRELYRSYMHTDLYSYIAGYSVVIYEPACNHIKLVSCAVNVMPCSLNNLLTALLECINLFSMYSYNMNVCSMGLPDFEYWNVIPCIIYYYSSPI